MRASSLEATSWLVKGALIACQPIDVALTAWCLAMYTRFGAYEINPIVEPLTGSPWGLLGLVVLKLVLAIRIAMMRVRGVPDIVTLCIALAAYLTAVSWNAWIALGVAAAVRS